MEAAKHVVTEILKTLIKAGARVNLANDDGYTALMKAVEYE